MASGSAKYYVVVSGNNISVPFTQHFDLDDAITMPENLQARHQTVTRLVSDMPMVNYATGSCSICMESFWQSDGAAASRQVSCGHVYHHNCITDWLLNGNSNSCPLCRHEISG
ncbi:E3 ubiquitin-protein ligase RNF181-like [Durio zibethinus]|uniref:RING-type E3 ubiquitin transferase n=1 Tax=Durio zibethinus TaxID=66656 RepID=A0A6P5ZUJ1_DURZI|nr:E3 ubiquitin-protein ligase RNF181-like [Durio zibethinus]